VQVSAVGMYGDLSLDSTYNKQQTAEYAVALGNSIFAAVEHVKGGILVFFPSYRLLHNLLDTWRQDGLLHSIESFIDSEVFVEPRSAKELDDVIRQYYAILDSGLIETASGKHTTRTAIMFAVCRGKVSEGINFSDHYARAVIVVGIPYPSIQDPFVKVKRAYQDGKHAIARNIHVNGDTWYKQQAFRAINQSVGRCIRHIRDFGVILLFDPRFQYGTVQDNLSKWLRGAVVNRRCISDAVGPIISFFDSHMPAVQLPSTMQQEQFAAVNDHSDNVFLNQMTQLLPSQMTQLLESSQESDADTEFYYTQAEAGGVDGDWEADPNITLRDDTDYSDQSVLNQTPSIPVYRQEYYDCIRKISVVTHETSSPCLPSELCETAEYLGQGLSKLFQFYDQACGDQNIIADASSPRLLLIEENYVSVNDWSVSPSIDPVTSSPASCPVTRSAKRAVDNSESSQYSTQELLLDGCFIRVFEIDAKCLLGGHPTDHGSSDDENDDLVFCMKIIATCESRRSHLLGKCWVLRDVVDFQYPTQGAVQDGSVFAFLQTEFQQLLGDISSNFNSCRKRLRV
jgi:hypothetical protein